MKKTNIKTFIISVLAIVFSMLYVTAQAQFIEMPMPKAQTSSEQAASKTINSQQAHQQSHHKHHCQHQHKQKNQTSKSL